MWNKTMAGILLALPLTVAWIGVAALLWPGTDNRWVLSWLLLAFPVWVLVLSLLPLHKRKRDSWYWLGGLTLGGFALVYLLKFLAGNGT